MRARWSASYVVAGVVCLAYAVFSAAYLVDYPAVYSDEPWLLSPVKALVREGELALPMFGEQYTTGLYFTGYLSAFLGVIGVEIAPARGVALAHSIGIVVLVFLLARQFAPRGAALAPAVLVVLFPFATASRFVRPDAIMTFYGLLALVLYGVARERASARWGFGAGLAAGFALGVFLVGLWSVLVLAAWILLDRRRRRVAVATAAGVVVGVLPLLLFAAATWSEYRRFATKFGGSSIFAARHQAEGPFATLWDVLLREPDRYRQIEVWSDSRVYVLAVAAAAAGVLATAAVRRDIRVLALALIPPALLAVSADNKTAIYLLVPAAILAVLVPYALPRRREVVGVLCVAGALAIAVPFANATRRDLQPLDTRFAEIEEAHHRAFSFPARSIVIGLPVLYAYWIDDPNVTFYSLHVLTRFEDFHLLDGPHASRKLARLAGGRPTFLVYDEGSFFRELAQFDLGQTPVLPSLTQYVLRCLRPIAVVRIRGSINGDYDERIFRRTC